METEHESTSKRGKTDSKKSKDLRQRAERLLSKTIRNSKPGTRNSELNTADMKKLIQELQIHQVELDLQNEELRKAQEEIEESRSKYVDLYDFAPVGYFTLTQTGEVVEVNLTGAKLLGVERVRLLGRLFLVFVDPAFRPLFRRHCLEVLKTGEKEGCELKLTKQDSTSFFASLESIAVSVKEDKSTCIRSVIFDITGRIQAEEEIRKLNLELEQRVTERTAQLNTANQALGEEIVVRKHAEEEQEKLIKGLKEALAQVKVLRGMLPICASCKKVKDDKGYWTQIEAYIRDHSEAEFSHGLCPECMKKLYPDYQL